MEVSEQLHGTTALLLGEGALVSIWYEARWGPESV